MSAPKLKRSQSLLEVRETIVWLINACKRTPHAEDQAPRFEAVLADWPRLFLAQSEHWDAQTAASVWIHAIDERLDATVREFHSVLLADADGDSKDPHVLHYTDGEAISSFVRPVLGAELESVRAWDGSLALETDPKFSAFRPIFAEDVKEADDALNADKGAFAKNKTFREVGELAKFLDKYENLRDDVVATLDKRRAEHPEWKLPRDFATSIFPSQDKPELTEEEKLARTAAKDAKRKKAEENAAKRKEALKAIQEAKKKLHELK